MGRYTHYYEIEVSHPGLHKYRHIRGADRWVVQQKAEALKAQWNAEWDRRSRAATVQKQRLARMLGKEARKEEAIQLTQQAQRNLMAAASILQHTLAVDDRVDWEALKDRTTFLQPEPSLPSAEARPVAPERNHRLHEPKFDILCKFSNSRKAARIADAARAAEADEEAWQSAMNAWQAATEAWHSKRADQEAAYRESVKLWAKHKARFLESQAANNAKIDTQAALVAEGDESAIIDMLDLVFSRSSYPEFVNLDYAIDYQSATKSVVLDFDLPNPGDMPTLREVRYVQTRDALDEKHISAAERSRLYDSLIYQIALRTLHEAFEADHDGNIDRITFNGWVTYVDKGTGADRRVCILTIGVNRSDFEAIDLGRVDPKECFKALKGVAASKLIGLAPVAPLERPREADRRFIPSEDVTSGIGEETNLAAMDWKDFEHLVRQVFEAEFSSINGEVRVTQASRDGGVDAVIFDPDPIRGGKIIVQAKRYTNIVDVSSVRDLYGTVQHEGATKGILVTTSQFGPDARKFAQDKPLTLIDGGNLLFLLQKMGVRARIDLAEAKAIQRATAGE